MYKNGKTYFDSERKCWHGRQNITPIYHSDVSCGQVILHVLEQSSKQLKQISVKNELKLTNGELAKMSIRIAMNIEKRGYQQNDIIGIVASNSQLLAPVVFGALLCGTPINNLDPTFQKGEIKHMFGVTRPKLVFCDVDNYLSVVESLKELNLNSPVYLVKGELEGAPTIHEFLKEIDGENLYQPPKLKNGGNQTAVILCSSGTTGLPKGVSLSHYALLRNSITNFNQYDMILCFSTIYWLSGLLILLYSTLSGSTRIIIDEPFSIEQCFDIIEKYAVSIIMTPPSQLAMLLQSLNLAERDLSSIRMYLCGGGAVDPKLTAKMQKLLRNGEFYVGYGMTEVAGVCTMETTKYKRLGTTGQLCDNIEVKLIKANGELAVIEERGEILIRNGLNWNGYFNNEQATLLTYDNDKWIHSGDLGYFDNDGYLHIIDRIKDILKYNNYHFYPTEIESVLMELDGVAEVCVCGIPDLVSSDLPAAAIVKSYNCDLSEIEIYDYVAGKLSNHKHLRGGIYFVDTLPLTASGKYKRNMVKQILTELYKQKSQSKS